MNYQNLKRNSLNGLNNPNWIFINTGVHDGSFNMFYDEFLLSSFINGFNKSPILRVYGWSKEIISLGKNQVLSNNDKSNNSFVKRITGGQAVFHQRPEDELTYSLCLPFASKLSKLYFEIGQILIFLLGKYGLNAKIGYLNKNYLTNFNCFNSQTPADIVVGDVKVIGSAQCRRKNHVLQHGSIKLGIIKKLSGKGLTFDQCAMDLKQSFQEKLKINFIE